MTFDEQVSALRHWGYTPREAGFLVYAALSSGYFLRRQYEAAGASGSQISGLLNKLMSRGHACGLPAGRRTVYHLNYAPMYRAIGDPGNRNRRTHGTRDIKARLMSLDFLLSRKERPLLTVQDKMDRLAAAGIGCEYYPQQSGSGDAPVRYFNDRHPMTVSDSGKLTFAYVDAGDESVKCFDIWLRRHQTLFSKLSAFQVVYVCCFPDLVPYMRNGFEQVIVRQRPHEYDAKTLALLAYFTQRRDLEQGKTNGFDRASLDLFRERKAALSGDEYDALYERWKDEGAQCLGATSGVSFAGEVLPWDYAALAAVPRHTRQTTATEGVTEPPRGDAYVSDGASG